MRWGQEEWEGRCQALAGQGEQEEVGRPGFRSLFWEVLAKLLHLHDFVFY
jgi:hypothetical protein